VYLLGDVADSLENESIKTMVSDTRVENLSGKMDLLGVKQLLLKAKLFIGNDSGPMHMAALSGIPTIGILGPNFPHISGPLGKNNIAVFHEQFCTGCNQRSCKYIYRCIKSVKTEEVIEAIDTILNGK